MIITDAQVHIWQADSPERPWRTGDSRPHRNVPYGAADLIADLDRAGVTRAVIVPAAWAGLNNDLALEAVRTYPDRVAVMGLLDVQARDSVDLATWRDQPGMLGIRISLTRGDPKDRRYFGFLVDGSADWVFSNAENHGIPIMIWSPGHNQEIAEVARRHPNLRLILDHLNLGTRVRGQQISTDLDGVLPLAHFSNIAIKVSGTPALANEPFPFPSLHPHLRRVINSFGIDRCMWGSDLTRLPCSYEDSVRAVTEGLDFLADRDKEKLMGSVLAEWLDWPIVIS